MDIISQPKASRGIISTTNRTHLDLGQTQQQRQFSAECPADPRRTESRRTNTLCRKNELGLNTELRLITSLEAAVSGNRQSERGSISIPCIPSITSSA